jgi:hypothetical protein
MFKKYIDFLTENFIASHREALKVDHWIHQSVDKIIVWVVSLATGSIALLLTNREKLTVSDLSINITLISLLASILLGVVGRIVYFEANRLYKKVTEVYEFEMRLLQLQYSPSEISENDTSGGIYFRIKEDFDFDLKNYIGIDSLKDFESRFNDAEAKQLYEGIYKYCKFHKDAALKEINTVINKTIGRDLDYKPSVNDTKKISEAQAKVVLNISKVMYLLCLVSFLVAATTIVVSHIKANPIID